MKSAILQIVFWDGFWANLLTKLNIFEPAGRHWRCSGIFIVNFQPISHLFLRVCIVVNFKCLHYCIDYDLMFICFNVAVYLFYLYKFGPKIGCSPNYLKFSTGIQCYMPVKILVLFIFLFLFFYSNFLGKCRSKILSSPNKLNLVQGYIVIWYIVKCWLQF